MSTPPGFSNVPSNCLPFKVENGYGYEWKDSKWMGLKTMEFAGKKPLADGLYLFNRHTRETTKVEKAAAPKPQKTTS